MRLDLGVLDALNLSFLFGVAPGGDDADSFSLLSVSHCRAVLGVFYLRNSCSCATLLPF